MQSTKSPHPAVKGSYLLANPFLKDPNFLRTVVLLTEHNEDGAVGFILNRPIQYTLNQILPEFPIFECDVFLGGPVQQDSLHYVHRIPEMADSSSEIVNGMYWGGDFEYLKSLVIAGKVTPDQIRFFVGYSGWGAEQLGGELDTESWIVAKPKPHFTFQSDSDLWKTILHSMGRKYQIISNFPSDPRDN